MTNSIQNIVLKIVDENSGGIKFLRLSLEVGKELHLMDNPFIEPWNDNFPALLLSVIRSMPELKILTYVHKMSQKVERMKYFIYRPLNTAITTRMEVPKQIEQIAA